MPPGRSSPAAERAPLILRRLRRAYPDARIALDYTSPLECVVATILSAQSTDVGVNKVTKSLFSKYRSPEDYLAATEEELQREIHATGFFRQKTKALKGLAQRLVDDFDSQVPKTMAELISLPGIARKTANIVQGNCFPETARRDPDAGMAVDTHVGRLAVRLGLTEHASKEAERIERDLMQLVPKRGRLNASNLFIEHGRRICLAKAPRCEDCVIEPLCPSSREAGMNDLNGTPRVSTRTTPTMVE
ncbi:MAG: endonuclease III [Actinomycetota bacterium]|nr:endonuclease III [Actinomycetota bacterium]